jgi:hypothetical protein
MADCKTVPTHPDASARDRSRPPQPVDAEHLQMFVIAAMEMHASIVEAHPSTSIHLDRVGVTAIDWQGHRWRLVIMRQPWSDAA